MAHTPGPWKAISVPACEPLKAKRDYISTVKFQSGGEQTYNFHPSYASIVGADGSELSMPCWGDGESEEPYFLFFAPDDARLIAAAPDLLEVCKQLMNVIIDTHNQKKAFLEGIESGYAEKMLAQLGDAFDPYGRVRAVLAARVAIAKAEGK